MSGPGRNLYLVIVFVFEIASIREVPSKPALGGLGRMGGGGGGRTILKGLHNKIRTHGLNKTEANRGLIVPMWGQWGPAQTSETT